MALTNTLIAQIAFKAGGDVFHQLFRHKPTHLPNVTPGKIQTCDLHQGQFGVAGSIIEWNYTIDGKAQKAKQVIHAIDEEKKLIAYKFLEGDLCELYKNLIITVHVETKGKVDYVTWTFEYELGSPDNPHPLSLLAYCIELTNDIEAHIFGK